MTRWQWLICDLFHPGFHRKELKCDYWYRYWKYTCLKCGHSWTEYANEPHAALRFIKPETEKQ